MVSVLQKSVVLRYNHLRQKKIIPSYIKEFAKQLLKNATETTKSLLMFQPTKTIPNFLPNIGHLKQSSLTQKCHGKSKGDTIPTIPFLEDVICA